MEANVSFRLSLATATTNPISLILQSSVKETSLGVYDHLQLNNVCTVPMSVNIHLWSLAQGTFLAFCLYDDDEINCIVSCVTWH